MAHPSPSRLACQVLAGGRCTRVDGVDKVGVMLGAEPMTRRLAPQVIGLIFSARDTGAGRTLADQPPFAGGREIRDIDAPDAQSRAGSSRA